MKIQNIKTAHIVRVRIELLGSMIDSGTVVIIFIILAIFVIYTIKHEWCPVLFKNNTVSNRYLNKFVKYKIQLEILVNTWLGQDWGHP